MVQRSPRPMIQIFDRNGQFIRRFGNDLQSPRAICIDQQGRIIIIESKIMKGNAANRSTIGQSRVTVLQCTSMISRPVVYGDSAICASI